MCLGAIYWARPSKVFFGNSREDANAVGFDDSLIYEQLKMAVEDRAIPTIRLQTPDAIKVFEEWAQKGDKTVY